MSKLSLVSVNVERSKHLDRIVPFLKSQDADVVCVQELMERDISILEEAVGGTCYFSPRCMYEEFDDEPFGIQGQGIISKLPFATTETRVYGGTPEPMPVFSKEKAESALRVIRSLTCVEVNLEDETFRFATTHFTWIPPGASIELQREDVQTMLRLLGDEGVVLVGDFNAPRGQEIFEKIRSQYTDNIPSTYMTSIDAMLHRAGKLRPHELADKMVDGLFTSAGYMATDVELHSGVSDHMAITADIRKI